MSFVAFDIRRLDVVEGEVAAFLVTEFGHPPEKVGVDRRVPGLNADKSEPRHLRLLRARRERPDGRRAAEQSDKPAPFHCAIPPVRSTERIAQLSYGGRLLRCGSQVESDAQACSAGSRPA